MICLKFLDQKSLLQLFLNCEAFGHFLTLPFIPKKDNILLPADWLELSCTEVFYVTEKKDGHMGLTKTERYNRINCVLSRIASLGKHHM